MQKTGNALDWGLVHDTPNAFVWEIGHTGNYTQPAGQLCDTTTTGWAVVSDLGGESEVNASCGAANYGTPFCSFPWYAYNSAHSAFTYGGDYPGTANDYNQGAQFATTEKCVNADGDDPQYCSTPISAPIP